WFFFPCLFLDRGALQLQEALAGGRRPACRGLCREPVRLRDLGRSFDFLAALQRREAAVRQLRQGANNVASECRRVISKSGGRAASADREEADRLEPRHRGGAARHPRHRQPPVPGVDLTPCNTTAPVAPPRNENGNVAN